MITATCVLASGERLAALDGPQLELDGRPVDGFAAVDRSDWHDPRGGDADVFSIAEAGDGGWLVAVHVGGLWWSGDRGATWAQVVPTDADVHHAVAAGDRAVVAAAAGVATSDDGGHTFGPFRTAGLDHRYSTAVALGGDALVVGSSDGPFASTYLYRGEWAGGPFERVGTDLPTVAPVQARFLLDGGDGFRFTADGTSWTSADGRAWAPA